jgi:hypothetical protein
MFLRRVAITARTKLASSLTVNTPPASRARFFGSYYASEEAQIHKKFQSVFDKLKLTTPEKSRLIREFKPHFGWINSSSPEHLINFIGFKLQGPHYPAGIPAPVDRHPNEVIFTSSLHSYQPLQVDLSKVEKHIAQLEKEIDALYLVQSHTHHLSYGTAELHQLPIASVLDILDDFFKELQFFCEKESVDKNGQALLVEWEAQNKKSNSSNVDRREEAEKKIQLLERMPFEVYQRVLSNILCNRQNRLADALRLMTFHENKLDPHHLALRYKEYSAELSAEQSASEEVAEVETLKPGL